MPIPTYFRNDGFVKSTLGPAVPGAQIYVATQPANVASLPPSPLANIYSDSDGLIPITQPILTDGFGHYDFYVLPGTYTIVVGLSGQIQQIYPDQTIGLAGSGSTLLLETNGVANGDQGLLNFHSADSSVLITDDGFGNQNFQVNPSLVRTASIQYTIDGGGSVPSTGAKGQVSIPVNCTVTGWVITANASGSAVVDVLKSTYAGFPSTSTIAGSEKPTLTSAQKNEDLTLTTWTTAVSAGDIIQFNLNSVATVTRVNVTLNVTIP